MKYAHNFLRFLLYLKIISFLCRNGSQSASRLQIAIVYMKLRVSFELCRRIIVVMIFNHNYAYVWNFRISLLKLNATKAMSAQIIFYWNFFYYYFFTDIFHLIKQRTKISQGKFVFFFYFEILWFYEFA